jgi:hypothetical protein
MADICDQPDRGQRMAGSHDFEGPFQWMAYRGSGNGADTLKPEALAKKGTCGVGVAEFNGGHSERLDKPG